MVAGPASAFAMGNRHVAMPPAGFRALFRGGTWTKTINDLVTIWAGTNPIPVCSQINNYDGDELWTSGPFVVDGLGVQLRGFRKSHQLIPASPDRSNGIAAGNHARDTRAGRLPCVSTKCKGRGRDGMLLLDGRICSRTNHL